MKRKLFYVTLNNTYSFYVFAQSHVDAVDKTQRRVNTNFVINNIISNDGSLQLPEIDLEIKSVKQLTNEIIF